MFHIHVLSHFTLDPIFEVPFDGVDPIPLVLCFQKRFPETRLELTGDHHAQIVKQRVAKLLFLQFVPQLRIRYVPALPLAQVPANQIVKPVALDLLVLRCTGQPCEIFPVSRLLIAHPLADVPAIRIVQPDRVLPVSDKDVPSTVASHVLLLSLLLADEFLITDDRLKRVPVRPFVQIRAFVEQDQ